MQLDLGDVRVRWLGGALLLDHPEGLALIEAPPGVSTALPHHALLRRLRAVVVPTGRVRSLGGLLDLLDTLTSDRGEQGRLHVLHPLDVERVAVVADAWVRGWPDGAPVSLDGAAPGVTVPLFADLEVTFEPLALGEPRGGRVVPVAGAGVRVSTSAGDVAWAPAARPGRALRRLCEGAELAVVETGRRSWPEEGWRPSPAEALEAASGAAIPWIVGDDGAWLDPAERPQ